MGETDKKYTKTYLSLGGGVQSSAMLMMAGLGLNGIPKPDVAIFADTRGELQDTYDWLAFLAKWAGEHGIPVRVVSLGDLEHDALDGKARSKETVSYQSLPVYVRNDDGSRGILRRSCTYDYKVQEINKEVRRFIGLEPGERAKGVVKVRALIGISVDEAIRMKASPHEWIDNVYPLVDARITRQACVKFLESQGVPVPVKSACYFCLAGETRIMTSQGARELKDCADDGSATVFVPSLDGIGGEWRRAQVLPFGRQRLSRIVLSRRTLGERIVYATADHRWLVVGNISLVNTTVLKKDDILLTCLSRDEDPEHEAWRVVSVKETDRVEEVYCAVVPGDERFALADGLVTANCPFHDDHYWKWLKAERPEYWKKAVEFDKRIRDLSRAGVRQPAFLHMSLKPLNEIDFDAKDRIQPNLFNTNEGFSQDCQGVCGV